jgi:hypothetical protein
VKELCTRYLADLQAGLILGKDRRPKKSSTITTDTGRIERHIIPLVGTRRVKDLTNKVLKHIMAGKTRVSIKTKKLRGKAIVRGGAGTATRTVGLLGGILTYAVEAGIIESNPAHGIRKPKDNVRKRRLSEAEYRILGRLLRDAAKQEKYAMIVDIVRSERVPVPARKPRALPIADHDGAVDEGLIQSFPASDPISYSGSTRP